MSEVLPDTRDEQTAMGGDEAAESLSNYAGRTVFALLARPAEVVDLPVDNGTWTMTPTVWATGDPSKWQSDQDREPDND